MGKTACVPENIIIKEGMLNLEIEKRKATHVVEMADGSLKKTKTMDYACGIVSTWGKFFQKYGWFEIRCKMPKVRGTTACFWLMPEKGGIGGPGGTEVDIGEYLAKWGDKCQLNLHWGGYAKDKHKAWGSGYLYVPKINDEFHTYALEWEPDKLAMYVDGFGVAECTSRGARVPSVAEYLIISCGVADWGGNWVVTDDAALPDGFQVDYVRVYEKK